MKSMHRLFIAVPLSPGVRSNLQRLQQELMPHIPGMRWLQSATMHLTLKFVGNVPVDEVYEVCQLAHEAVAEIEPFGFHLEGLGTFPNVRRAKVLWVAAGGELEPLQTLATRLETAAQDLGIRAEPKAYRPHVTLARAIAGGTPDAAAMAPVIERYAGREHAKVFVREIVTYRSNLRREGAEYEVLAKATLAG